MKIKKHEIIAILIILMASSFTTVIVTAQAGDGPEWPTSWILASSIEDPQDCGTKDWKDGRYVYYYEDSEYLFLRLECYGYPNITQHPEDRFKWFIDIDAPHNMTRTGEGNTIVEAEYLLFVEDTPKDGENVAKIYLMYDANNDSKISKQDSGGDYNNSCITNESIAGYREEGHFIDFYVRKENISSPVNPYTTWQTDAAGGSNLDSASALDQSDVFWNTSLSLADLEITKSANASIVDPGDLLTYTLEITNWGPDDAEDVCVTDILPDKVSFVDASSSVMYENNSLIYWWNFSSLNAGESETIKINVTVSDDAIDNITNNATVTITSDTIFDPYNPNNKASTITNITVEMVNLYVNIVGNGSISPSEGVHSYEKGSIVDIEATADLGWTFVDWTGDKVSSENPVSITMDNDKTVTAHFTQDQYNLSVIIDGNGSVIKDPDQATYVYGEEVELNVSADLGWTFVGWSGDLISSENTVNITMNGDKTVTATFSQNHYNLIINVVGSGSVSPGNSTYVYGTNVVLTATAEPGWTFSYWSDDISGSINPQNIVMDNDKTVTAHFTQDQYTLTVNSYGNGTVSIEPNQATYIYGTAVNFTANPDIGWFLSHWDGDLSGSDSQESVVMDSDKVVNAYFIESQYSLNVVVNGSGLVVKTPDQASYTYGAVVNLTAVADLGWTFSHWSNDLDSTNYNETVFMDDNKNIFANFVEDKYTLTITIEGSGSVSKTPDQNDYIYGINVQLTATPASGWKFSKWTGDITGTNNPAIINMTDDKSVTVYFSRSSSGPSGDDGSNPGGISDIIYLNPTANAGGPYYALIDEAVEFNGSQSIDNDEGESSIVRYDWKFFDEDEWHNNTSATPTHVYSEPGTYKVTLRVIDNEGSSDENITFAIISQPNRPPNTLQITGPLNGTQNTSYLYTVIATDLDNDDLQYVVDFNDGKDLTTDYYESGLEVDVTHLWSKAGIYTISAIAYDTANASSNPETLVVLIDIHYVKEIGYLIDDDGDGTYDNFYSNSTGNISSTKKRDDGKYLVSDDDDDDWEWVYDVEPDTLEPYKEDNNYPCLLILLLLILLGILLLALLRRRKKKEEEKTPKK